MTKDKNIILIRWGLNALLLYWLVLPETGIATIIILLLMQINYEVGILRLHHDKDT